jgi:hypothetical protein
VPPRPGPQAGLFLELPPRGRLRVLLDSRGVDVETAGGDLEERPAGRHAVLPDEGDPLLFVERDDRDRTGVAGDVTGGP